MQKILRTQKFVFKNEDKWNVILFARIYPKQSRKSGVLLQEMTYLVNCIYNPQEPKPLEFGIIKYEMTLGLHGSL